MQPQLTKPQWCGLPQDIRTKLREIFSIQRSEGSEVVNNQIVSDGSSHQDLQAISVASMQEYLQTTEDNFAKLFDQVLAKINPPLIYVVENSDEVVKPSEIVDIPAEQIEEYKEPVVEPIPEEVKTILKKRGMPKGGWPKKEIINANKNEDVKTSENGA